MRIWKKARAKMVELRSPGASTPGGTNSQNTFHTHGGATFNNTWNGRQINNTGKATFNFGTSASRPEFENECFKCFYDPDNAYETFKDRNPRRVEGTCLWALDSEKYKHWLGSDKNELLLISADPGCGKSVLARSLIDHDLPTQNGTIICYYFFKDQATQSSLKAALRAVLYQLLSQAPEMIDHALEPFETKGEGIAADPKEMWKILLKVAADSKSRPLVCVFDALDECRDHDRYIFYDLLSIFLNSSNQHSSFGGLKILATSRPYQHIEEGFKNVSSTWPHIRVRAENQSPQIQREINLVAEMRVRELSLKFGLSDQTNHRLLSDIRKMQHRTYLWLYLTIEELRVLFESSYNPDEIILPSLPNPVEDAYERVLSKIKDQHRQRAREILLIVVGARRPLTVGEIALAIGAYLTSNKVDSKSLVRVNRLHLEAQIREWCGLFLFFQGAKVLLIHQTAKEFLLEKQSITTAHLSKWRHRFNAAQVEHTMADLCATFILHFESLPPDAEHEVSQKEDWNFWEYCAIFWLVHIRDRSIDQHPELLGKVMSLFVRDDPAPRALTFAYRATFGNHSDQSNTPFQILLAFHGHKNIIQSLYAIRSFNINELDKDHRSALICAATEGKLDVVRWLLQMDADIGRRMQGGWDENALDCAVREGHLDVVDLLLNAHKETGTLGSDGSKALCVAIEHDQDDLVQKLIRAGIRPSKLMINRNQSLSRAAGQGDTKVVQFLLDQGADVNVENWGIGSHSYSTPLVAASSHGHLEVVDQLLLHGALVNHGTLNTPLVAACLTVSREASRMSRQVSIVRRLLSAGADPDQQDHDCFSPLHMAIEGDGMEVIELLLAAGATVDPKTRGRVTPLRMAAEDFNLPAMRILIEAGASIDTAYETYFPPKRSFAEHDTVLSELVRARVKSTGCLSGSMLGTTAEYCSASFLKGFFYPQNKMQATQDDLDFAVSRACCAGRLENVQILLDAGATDCCGPI